MTPQAERLFKKIEERKWMGRMVPIDRLADLREAINSRCGHGLIDESLFRDQLTAFSFDPPFDLSGARSILIVAVPTPQMRVVFHWR